MSVLTITLSVVLFTIVVTGQVPEEPRDKLICSLLGCRPRINCRREPHHRCCRMCPQDLEKRCLHKGKWYDHNSIFEDECNSCFCNNGNVACTKIGCGKGCTYNGKWYADGDTFKKDCNTCTCKKGSISCTEIACGKGCFHNGKYYKNGESFKIDCNGCTCRNGMPICTMIACPTLTCLYKGKEYQPNEKMPSEIRCESCYCRKGKRQCNPVFCPACAGPIRPGTCCPDCSGGLLEPK